MQITTNNRADLIRIAARIADDIETAAALPANAVTGADRHSGQPTAFLLPEENPFHRPDRTQWLQLAAWLRNIAEFIDNLPDDIDDPEAAVPEFVWALESKLVVNDSNIITWWTPAALDANHPKLDRIGNRFVYTLTTLLQGDDPAEVDDLLATMGKQI